jgi:hypothetical protein
MWIAVIDILLLDIAALAMVDEAYLDRTEWVKKSIRTTAKVGSELNIHRPLTKRIFTS